MDCLESEGLAAYAEGRLDPARAAEVLDHCAECDSCRRELAVVTLRLSAPQSSVPAELQEWTLSAVRWTVDRDKARRHSQARLQALRPRKSYVGVVAAAALFLAFVGVVLLVSPGGRESAPPSADSVTAPAGKPAPLPETAHKPAPAAEAIPGPARTDPAGEGPAPRAPEPAAPIRPPVLNVPPPRTRPPQRREPSPPPFVPEPAPAARTEGPREPAPLTHTVAARSLAEIQLTDFTGALLVRRKGARDASRIQGVVRVNENDVVTAEKVSSFQVEGRHPVVLGENTSVSVAYVPQEQAPYLHIRSGEAMVDSTGPSRWVVTDGRVAVVVQQARARFATSPADERLKVMALSEPLYLEPDGGRVYPLRPGEELQVGRSAAEVKPADADRAREKGMAFEAARPRQRTIFYTSCDAADAKRGHFFVHDGKYLKDALLSDDSGKSSVVTLSPNPRFAWRQGLTFRFRYRTNAINLTLALRAEEKRYTLFQNVTVDRKNVNQLLPGEVVLTVPGTPFRRDDGQLNLTVTSQDKFDWIQFGVRQQDVFGDAKAYVLVDDVQVIERE